MSEQATTGAPAPELRPPHELVSRRAPWYWLVRAGVGWVALVAAELVALVVWWDAVAGWGPAVVAVSAVVAAAHLAVMPRWRYRVHRWEVTPEAVYTQAGWLNQERRIAPASRIQTVDTERGPLQQLFGLTNVTVTTASAAGPLVIDGLDDDTARRVVDDLTARTQAHPGDAT